MGIRTQWLWTDRRDSPSFLERAANGARTQTPRNDASFLVWELARDLQAPHYSCTARTRRVLRRSETRCDGGATGENASGLPPILPPGRPELQNGGTMAGDGDDREKAKASGRAAVFAEMLSLPESRRPELHKGGSTAGSGATFLLVAIRLLRIRRRFLPEQSATPFLPGWLR